MISYQGTVVEGAASLLTSVAGVEILSNKYINFELLNDGDCHVSINGGAYIFVRAHQGICIDIISSLKIYESGVSFNWIGTKA